MIVLTGLGAVTALGSTLPSTWERVLRGERALSKISLFPADGYRVDLVAEIPGFQRAELDACADFSRTSELALAAAREALAWAGLAPSAASTAAGGPRRIGLVVGGSTAGMLETEMHLAVGPGENAEVDTEVRDAQLRRMLSHPLSAPTDRLARELGPFTRVRSLSSACSSGANAILVGATWLELGLCDVVLCGAADALCRVTLSGFNALGALDPEGARPFDRRRRGLTLGEGAGFVVLERREDAVARGATAVCSLLGWAARAEAHHITNPEPSGDAPSRAMTAALARAGLTVADLDYVNAHGTGTPLNDPMESKALVRVLGPVHVARVPVSSQKGQFGHTLAAAGAIEATITALAIAKGIVPPTGGLEEPDPECPLLHVREAESRPIRAAMSSSFGFGGMDTVLVFGRADAVAGEVKRTRASSSPPRAVVITGAAVITPAGIFDGADVAALAERACALDAITFDISAELDLDRARRLDRGSRLAAIACERALGRAPGRVPAGAVAGAPGRYDAGVVLGNAFGAVDGTAGFMRRLREKGPRLASPADFPGLVPSSPAGHVSIYLGLIGPTLVVADLATSGECAVTQGFELVAVGETDRVVVVAVEEKSTIVDQVFRVVFGPDRRDAAPGGRPLRREGAAAVALAAEETAVAEGLPVLARVVEVRSWWSESPLASAPPPPLAAERAVVVIGAVGASVDTLLDHAGWATCRRIVCAAQAGSHEAVGGIAVAVAAASFAADASIDQVLCVGIARGSGYAILLGRWSARSS